MDAVEPEGGAGTDEREALLRSVAHERAREALASLRAWDAYAWARLFPRTSGLGAASDIRRRVRMLRSVEGRLDFLLFPGERIEFVTRGILNSFVEQYFMGIWSYVVNRTVFLFTNYRVILLNSDRKSRAKVMMWQIPYARMRKYGAGTVAGSVGFKLSRRTYKFFGVPRGDRKRLKEFMRGKLEAARTGALEFPSHEDRDPLCPRCGTPLVARARACAECGDEMINPMVPAAMSLAIPGLGDLYLGHHSMAAVELVGFAMVLLIVLAMVVGGGGADVAAGLVLLAAANTFDAVVTFHVARKGALPRRLAWKGR